MRKLRERVVGVIEWGENEEVRERERERGEGKEIEVEKKGEWESGERCEGIREWGLRE